MPTDDLDEIRAALATVENPAALLEGFFACAPVGLQIYRRDGHCLVVNKAFRELFGSVPPPDYNIFQDEVARARGIDTLIRRAFAGETVATPAVWYDPRDLQHVKVEQGNRVGIAATFFPVFDRSGAVSHVAISFRNMTAELAAKEQLEAERDLLRAALNERDRTAEFREHVLGIIGHDLRSPLTAILASAALLLKPELPERMRTPVMRIVNSGERMRRMIADLLDFTRTRLGGGLILDRAEVDAAILCRNVVDELRAGRPNRVIAVETGGETTFACDPDRVSQIITNLVENALRYGPEDRPVSVEVRGADGVITIAVHNFGPPIPPEDRERIFEAYSRARRPHDTTTGAGLGLGLYIVRAIAVAHGGTVEVESEADAGTTFRVRLPR